MEINDFILHFASQFEETEASLFTASTVIRSLDEWSSFTTLSIIAMVDEVYTVKITGEDIQNSKTIEDLYNIVKSKL